MASRYYPQLDIDTFDRFNRELVGDLFNDKDGIINQEEWDKDLKIIMDH